MVEEVKITSASFKRSNAGTAALSAPSPAAGHHQPTPLLETPGHSQPSLGQSLTAELYKGFSGGTSGKEPICQFKRHKRQWFDPWVGKIPWRRAWQPTLVFLPGESHGQRSLVATVAKRLKQFSKTDSRCSLPASCVMLKVLVYSIKVQNDLES